MPREAISTLWLMGGYFVLILLMGIFVTRIQKMRGIKTQPAILGALFWTIGMIAYAILGNNDVRPTHVYYHQRHHSADLPRDGFSGAALPQISLEERFRS